MLQHIADLICTTHETIGVHVQSIRSLAEQMRMLRRLAVDTAHDNEDAKRELVRAIDDQLPILLAACELVENGPLAAGELRDELSGMLGTSLSLASLPGMDGFHTTGQVVQFCKERANNIAQAYAGRVLREPKEQK